MKMDNLLLILNCKHMLKLAVVLLIGSIAIAGALNYYLGELNTTVNVTNDPQQSDTYNVIFYDNDQPQTIPFTMSKSYNIGVGGKVTEEYKIENNEGFSIDVLMSITDIDTDLNVSFMGGSGQTLLSEYSIPANSWRYFYITYEVKQTATEGTTLNANIEFSVQAT